MSRGVGRIQRHMEHIANTIEAMLDLLEIIQNLPAARNRDLVALLAIGCLVALSLLRVMAAARKLLAASVRGDATHATTSGRVERADKAESHAMPAAAVRGSRSASRWNTNADGRNDRRYASPVVRAGIPVAAQQGPCEEQVRQYRSCQVERLPGRERRAPRLPERERTQPRLHRLHRQRQHEQAGATRTQTLARALLT